MDKETLTAQLDRMKYLYDETEKLKKCCKGLHSIDDRGAFVSPEYFNEIVELDDWDLLSGKWDTWECRVIKNGVAYYTCFDQEGYGEFIERLNHEDNK